MTDKELLDYIEIGPNSRLPLVKEAWIHLKGGLTFRAAIEYCIVNYPNAGFTKDGK